MVFQNFNPRTHEGYDHDFFTNEKLPFNSFNPRTREGYDIAYNERNYKWYVLIPVPIKGTIRTHTWLFLQNNALIPVPTEGTIQFLLTYEGEDIVLIPVPTEGTMAKLYKINNNSTVLFR